MTLYYSDDQLALHHGDALDVARELPAGAADCIVTSPPYYGLRDYGEPGQYGLEDSPTEYVERIRGLFAELRRVLADDGTLWLNLGDSYAGSWGNQGHNPHRDDFHTKQRRHGAFRESATHTGSIRPGMPAAKNLIGIPWRVAFALQDDGWILRNAIIWHKPNAMPESITDRLAGRYEHVFLFAKQRRYWFDLDAIRAVSTTSRAGALTWDRETDDIPGQKPQHRRGRSWPQRSEAGAPGRHGLAGAAAHSDSDFCSNEKGRNPGDVWVIPTQPFPDAHFAVMPARLAQQCILAGCKPAGVVLDPFSGSGTTGLAAQRTGRRYVGIDLSSDYLDLSLRTRLRDAALDFEAPA